MTKYIPIIASVGFIGCSPFHGLPEEAYEYVARQMEYTEAEAVFVEELAMASRHNGVFNATQETGAEAFLDDHAQTLDDLAYFFANDQIVGFYEDEYPKKNDSVAFYRNNYLKKDVIVINLDFYEYATSSTLTHEAGHALIDWHPPILENMDGVIYDASLAEIVIQKQDYPYFLTLLYDAAERVLADPHGYATRVVQSYQADVQNNTMTPQEAYDELILLIRQEKEDWVNNVMKNAYTNMDYAATFGWSEEEFANALRVSGMFEYQQDVFREYICGFTKEYQEVDAKECQE